MKVTNLQRIKPNENATCAVKVTGYNSSNCLFDVVLPSDLYLFENILTIPQSEGQVNQDKVGVAIAGDYELRRVEGISETQTTNPYYLIFDGDYLTTCKFKYSKLYKPGGFGWGFDKRGNYCLKIYKFIGDMKLKYPYLYIGWAGAGAEKRGIYKCKIKNVMQFKVIAGGGLAKSEFVVRPAPLAADVDIWHKLCSSIFGIALDSEDNVIGVGYVYSSNNIWHLDNDGNLNWDYNANGKQNAVCVDSGDNVIVAGERTYDEDVINDCGGTWQTSTSYSVGDICQEGSDYYECIQNHVSDSGTPWVNRPYYGSDWQSYWKNLKANVRKFNSSGVLQWRYDTGTGEVNSVAIDSNDNIYLGCDRNSDNDSVIKLNSSGAYQWGYDTGDNTNGIDVDSNDDIIAVGVRAQDEDGDTASVRKLNSSGVKQWEYDISAEGTYLDSYAVAVDKDTNNDIYLSAFATYKLRSIVKIDTDANYKWYKNTGAICLSIAVQKGLVLGGVYYDMTQYTWHL